MATTSNAELLFRELQALKAESEEKLCARIEAYVDRQKPTSEWEWLDFKTANKGNDEERLFNPWARAITGFRQFRGWRHHLGD